AVSVDRGVVTRRLARFPAAFRVRATEAETGSLQRVTEASVLARQTAVRGRDHDPRSRGACARQRRLLARRRIREAEITIFDLAKDKLSRALPRAARARA